MDSFPQVINYNSYLPIYFDVCFSAEASEFLGQKSAGGVDVQGLQVWCTPTWIKTHKK